MSNLKNNALSVFAYEGANISFRTLEGHVMVNATEMAKTFGKEPVHFLRNKQTKEYITILSQSANLQSEKIVDVQNGGSNPGTWLHELIALRFAQWLSPHFSIWVDKHIKELLTKGNTEIKKQTISKTSRHSALPQHYDYPVKTAYCFAIRVEIYASGRKEYFYNLPNAPVVYEPTLEDLKVAHRQVIKMIQEAKNDL